MGIYDREYYREPTSRSPWAKSQISVCKALIGTTIAVLVLQLVFSPRLTDMLVLLKPFGENRWQLWRFVTAAFCHSERDIFHIVWNMLFLWWFGHELERIYGPREFLAFYVTAALFASLCFTLLPSGPESGRISMLGASGAVSAVVTVYTIHYPRHTVFLFGMVPIEMRWLLGIYALRDIVPLLQNSHTGVAHAAHLGGLVFGFVYKWQNLRLGRVVGYWARHHWNRPRLRVIRLESQPVHTDGGMDEHLETELDQILSKLHREGRKSLTEHEQKILDQASRQLRDRKRRT